MATKTTKTDAVLKLLERQQGATVAQLQKATGWRSPTASARRCRGSAKKDHDIRREQSEKGVTVYKTAER